MRLMVDTLYPEIFDALRATDNTHEHQGEFTQTEAINQLASKAGFQQ